MRDGTLITTIFARHVINLIDSRQSIMPYYPDDFKNGFSDRHHIDYECALKDCHLGPDGMWITNEKTSTDGCGNYINYDRFLWRIEPNYCCRGKPMYTADDRYKLFKASETKKTIISSNNHSICIEWFEFDQKFPTENVWGLKMGKVYITVYKEDKRIWTSKKNICEKGWKKEFTTFIEEHFKWKGKSA